MPKFIPGLRLSKLFYESEVRPILSKNFPRVPHSAALIGWGSEVLGFDTHLSRDHHWGPRVLLFLREKDSPKFITEISEVLSAELPYEFMGYSTNFGEPEPSGARHPVRITSGPVDHMVSIYTVRSLIKSRLGLDLNRRITVDDWLSFPPQRLLELTSGEVYYDGLGQLAKARRKLQYYPKDVWLFLMGAQWSRIAVEEAFVGRTGDVGDELGSQIVAARLVDEIIKLSFLIERTYAPYSKWLGTAFRRLRIARRASPILRNVLLSKTWKTRENWLSQAYSLLAKEHNALKITKPLSTKTSDYYSRRYSVIFAGRFAEAISQSIKDPAVKKKIKTG